LKTRRAGAFKERSSSAQHKLFTTRKVAHGYVLDADSASFLQNKDNFHPSDRNMANINMSDLRNQLKRTKNSRMKSSSSAISKNLSSEFYLEYFKILKFMQHPQNFTKTIAYDHISPKRTCSSNSVGIKMDAAKVKKSHLQSQALQCNSGKRRCSRRFRPKSAPGLRKIHMINKGRRGTIDADKLANNQFKYIEQQEVGGGK